ncbi:MAG: 3-hydroxyanthranilate 3,4-dioxygenase [Ignavibacteria bacterium]|jgi:3-hydroxyanthranilate 3,4-dioxygenase|nr:3-hydroxyanthranilate 3,4-dioxygenase [Ignavibacteria bacterium]MBK9228340.1 3-hydroxyanthranilate 3,4-dioxygenase [Ignavibacteria bacterium]
MLPPINFKKWIEENRHLMKPPVGNKCVYDGDFIVMVVGGPNSRKDYHFQDGPEFFYQVEGDIQVGIVEDGEQKVYDIKEGEIFYVPPKTPHSPRRPANTIGLVIERKRNDNELDGFQWYCENCGTKLHEKFFTLTNIVTQLPPLLEEYYNSTDLRTCKSCGHVMTPPVKIN